MNGSNEGQTYCGAYCGLTYIHTCTCMSISMNNHIYSTLFKTLEREPDRSSKEIEQRMESQNTHTNKTTRTCDPKYRTTIYCINIKFPSSLNGLEIFYFGFDKNVFKNWLASSTCTYVVYHSTGSACGHDIFTVPTRLQKYYL